MSLLIFTTCDRCNTEQKIRERNGRGYIEWPRKVACAEFGWRRRGGEDICPECQDEERVKP